MSNKTVLTNLLKKRKLTKQADFLFNQEPFLEDILLNLIDFITPHFVGNDMPLIDECIYLALSKIDKKKPHHENLKNFYTNLVAHAYILFEKRIAVVTKIGTSAWEPMIEPVSEFLRRNAGLEIIMVEGDDLFKEAVTKNQASLMLASRIMPAHAVSTITDCVCENR